MFNVEIIGTGSYVPCHKVSNDQISNFVDTSDEWIRERTGIKERRISLDEDTSQLALQAAREALKDAEVSPQDLDLIIVATATPEYFFPSTACIIQGLLGADRATCFDISAACTGFIYALNTAAQFIKSGFSETALVVGAEVLSKIVDWEDRNTCVLFADGAGAALLRRGDEGLISVITGSDGTGGSHLECPAVPLKNKFAPLQTDKKSHISMNGREIYKYAVKVIVESVEKVLANSEFGLEDIKYIIPHQANVRIIDAAAKKLGIEKERFYINLDKYGNTSGASIPIALDEIAKKEMLVRGDKIILVGFGAGLTNGAELIQWTK